MQKKLVLSAVFLSVVLVLGLGMGEVFAEHKESHDPDGQSKDKSDPDKCEKAVDKEKKDKKIEKKCGE